MSNNIVIGINCSHDSSVCLLDDGHLVAALCEERISRHKHEAGFPSRALAECLSLAGLDNSLCPASIVINQLPPSDHLNVLRRELPFIDDDTVHINPSHHLLHACYAKAASGFPECAILVADGSGYSYGEHRRRGSPLLGQPPADQEACEALTMLYCDSADKMKLIERQWGMWDDNAEDCYRFPSLGHMYSLASQRIFGSWIYAGKVMGLAPYGDPHALPLEIIKLSATGISVRTDWIFEVPISNTLRTSDFRDDPVACNLAARVQFELERAMIHLVKILQNSTHSRHLCLTGGVALNSVCNGRLVNSGIFPSVFITPAAQDAGIAIGAAAFGHHIRTGAYPDLASRLEFLGREYDDARLERAAQSVPGIICEGCHDAPARAAADLASGHFVGWFEGASEFGPRALGHRSILADPRGSSVKDQLNGRVKYREAFRPYAAAVIEEEAADWFEIISASPHMLLVADVKPVRRTSIPAVVHVDGSCRLQTVDANHPGGLRQLLEHFRSLTGIPMVLNTSLNLRGEPTCETPEDAIQCFIRSGLDVLYLGNKRLLKLPSTSAEASVAALVPALRDAVVMTNTQVASDGCWQHVEWSVSVDCKWEINIDAVDARALIAIDGEKTVGDLASASNVKASELLNRFYRLRDRGVLYFKRR